MSRCGSFLRGNLIFLTGLSFFRCAPAPPASGVIVQEVKAWGAAFEVGLSPGDVLVSWDGAGGSGEIHSPFDVFHLEIAKRPLGPFRIQYMRDGEPREVTMTRGEWEIETAPLSPSEGPQEPWAAVLRGRRLIENGDIEGGRAEFSSALTLTAEPTHQTAVLQLEAQALDEAGENAAAEAIFGEVVDRRRAGGRSPELASALLGLGRTRFFLMSYKEGQEALSEALSIYESFDAPVESAEARNHLGNIALQGGNLEAAQALYLEAIAVRERLAPRSPLMAVAYANEGIVLRRLGQLTEAEKRYLQALELRMEIDPEGVLTGYVLNILGVLSKEKGDVEESRGYYERALAIFREKRPGKLEVAGVLSNLGNLALLRGDAEAAESYHREALQIREGVRPGNLDVAASLHNLARTLVRQGRLDEAVALLENALAIKQREVPDSPFVATSLVELGKAKRSKGDFDEAESYLRRASTILSASAPESADMAVTFFALGSVARDRGNLDEAEVQLRRAVTVVEGTRDRLSYGSEERSRFQARFSEDYRELVELLVDSDRLEEAFELLESIRARSLRALLAERDIAPGVPSDLRSERRRLEQRLDQSRARLARASVSREKSSLAAMQDSVRELQSEIDLLDVRARQLSPALAALEPPRVSLEEIRARLDPRSRLLSYSVGLERSQLFVVEPSDEAGRGIAVHSLPIGERELAERIDRFLSFLERGRTSPEVDQALLRQGRALHELLLDPAATSLEHAERLVIVSEGALLALPFSALVRSETPLSYLGRAMPIRHVESAGVMVELARRPPPRFDRTFEAFGDPKGEVGSGNLPHARNEVHRLGELFGERGRVLLGEEATEHAVKSLKGSLQFLHFAGHSRLDGRFPLNSALLLSPSGSPSSDDEGLLHAWEIAEGLRVEIGLVTLSACETARGREVKGEGLVGLARAFQIAGARAVLASLWEVSDRSTSELMVRFYRELERGAAKDDALRTAELELADSERWRHPYHWAGFRLIGDRRPSTQGAETSNETIGEAIGSPSSSNPTTRQ